MHEPPSPPTCTAEVTEKSLWRRGINGAMAIVLLLVIGAFLTLRFIDLDADPTFIELNKTGSFFGDEGLWYAANLWHETHGAWYHAGEYNPAIVVPVMPLLVAAGSIVSDLDTWSLARWMTAATICPSILLLMLAIGWRCGWWAALLVGLLLATSYELFVFSRVALLDAPGAAFAMIGLCLLLGWRGPRPAWATVLAALIGFIAVLCKSTMIVVMPVYVVAAWMTAPPHARWFRDPVLVTGVGVLLLAIFAGVLLTWFPEDLARFRETNVGRVGGSGAGGIGGGGDTGSTLIEFVKGGLFTGEWVFGLALACTPFALVRLRGQAAYPWVVACVIWIVLMSGAILFKGLMVPRYFVAQIAPAAILIALVAVEGWRRDTGRTAGWVLCLIVVVASGRGAAEIALAMRSPDHTFRDMGHDIHAIVTTEQGSQPGVIAGRWPAHSVGLAANIPVHSMWNDFDKAFESYPIRHLVTRGTIDYPETAADSQVQYIVKHFDVEPVASYTVMPELERYPLPIVLYRLTPKPETTEDDAAALPAE